MQQVLQADQNNLWADFIHKTEKGTNMPQVFIKFLFLFVVMKKNDLHFYYYF